MPKAGQELIYKGVGDPPWKSFKVAPKYKKKAQYSEFTSFSMPLVSFLVDKMSGV